MNKQIKWLLMTMLGLAMIIVLGLWIMEAIGWFGSSDDRFLSKMQSYGLSGNIHYYTGADHTLRRVSLGDTSQQPLILIHGTPGSITTRYTLLEETTITDHYHVIILDRPGFGRSMPGKAYPHIHIQGNMIGAWIQSTFHEQDVILVGHSFAGEIMPYIAALYKDHIQGMVIIAGAMDPKHQIIRLPAYFAHIPIIKSIIPPSQKVTAYEKLYSRSTLATIVPLWEQIQSPTVIVHGTNDWLVPYENALFADDMLKNADHILMTIKNGNHFIPFEKTNLIMTALQELSLLIETDTHAH